MCFFQYLPGGLDFCDVVTASVWLAGLAGLFAVVSGFSVGVIGVLEDREFRGDDSWELFTSTIENEMNVEFMTFITLTKLYICT